MLINFALFISECVTTNVTAKPDTFLREPNPRHTVVFHMCSCKTIVVSKKHLSNSILHRIKCRTEAVNHLSRSLKL